MGALPLEIAVVNGALHVGVVGIIGLVVGGGAGGEHQSVGVGVGGIEHLKRRQLDALAVACMDGERGALTFYYIIAGVETWRQTAGCAIAGAADHRYVVAETCHKEQRTQGQTVLDKEGEVAHGGQRAIVVGAPGGGKAHVLIIGSLTVVARRVQFAAHRQAVHGSTEAACPVGLELQLQAQRLLVVVGAHIPIACGTEDNAARAHALGIVAGDGVAVGHGVQISL